MNNFNYYFTNDLNNEPLFELNEFKELGSKIPSSFDFKHEKTISVSFHNNHNFIINILKIPKILFNIHYNGLTYSKLNEIIKIHPYIKEWIKKYKIEELYINEYFYLTIKISDLLGNDDFIDDLGQYLNIEYNEKEEDFSIYSDIEMMDKLDDIEENCEDCFLNYEVEAEKLSDGSVIKEIVITDTDIDEYNDEVNELFLENNITKNEYIKEFLESNFIAFSDDLDRMDINEPIITDINILTDNLVNKDFNKINIYDILSTKFPGKIDFDKDIQTLLDFDLNDENLYEKISNSKNIYLSKVESHIKCELTYDGKVEELPNKKAFLLHKGDGFFILLLSYSDNTKKDDHVFLFYIDKDSGKIYFSKPIINGKQISQYKILRDKEIRELLIGIDNIKYGTGITNLDEIGMLVTTHNRDNFIEDDKLHLFMGYIYTGEKAEIYGEKIYPLYIKTNIIKDKILEYRLKDLLTMYDSIDGSIDLIDKSKGTFVERNGETIIITEKNFDHVIEELKNRYEDIE